MLKDWPFRHECPVGALAFSPDGKVLATGSEDSVVRLWDAATGKLLRSLAGHRGRILALAFAPDGRRLASGSSDEDVRVWDPATAQLRFRCQGHDGSVLAVAFSPDGKTLASGSYDQTLQLWDGVTGKVQHKAEGHEGAVSCLSFAPDGKAVVTAGYDRSVRVWDVASGKETFRLDSRRKNGELTGVAFCADGRFVVSGIHSFFVRLDADLGKYNHRLVFGGDSLCLACSANRRILALGSNEGHVEVWETSSETMLGSFDASIPRAPVATLLSAGRANDVRCVAVSPDGLVVASANKGGHVVLAKVHDLVEWPDKPLPPLPVNEKTLETYWADLASDDGPHGIYAVTRLAEKPEIILPYLKKRFLPVGKPDEKQVARLVAELDDEKFEVRERASAELSRQVGAVAPLLRKAVQNPPSAEVRSRLERILDLLEPGLLGPEQLRQGRILHLLDYLNSPASQEVLQGLAEGRAGASLTEEARAILTRRKILTSN